MKTIKITLVLSFFFFSSVVFAQNNYKSVDQVEGKAIGEKVTDFSAIDQSGAVFNLKEALKKGPVVLFFYRGQWCPVCNRHLSDLNDSLSFIQDMGATIVAVSPEKQENLLKTASKTGAQFTLIYDENYVIADDFDVAFVPEVSTINLYDKRLGADLKNAHSDTSMRLPVPATYVITQEGVVSWRHFDRDYKKRASVQEIILALEQLQDQSE